MLPPLPRNFGVLFYKTALNFCYYNGNNCLSLSTLPGTVEVMSEESNIPLKVKLLHRLSIMPTRGSAGAAGLDLHYCPNPADTIAPLILEPGQVYVLPTGVAVEIPERCEGQVRLRSSVGKRGFIIPNGVGTIDSDYRGEIRIMVAVLSPQRVMPGDRLAQLVISPVLTPRITLIEVSELSETDRGEGGFGSTGV